MKNYINHLWKEHRLGLEYSFVALIAMALLCVLFSWATGFWWGWREALIPILGVLMCLVNFVIIPAMYTYDNSNGPTR